jgi:hypothetical protein
MRQSDVAKNPSRENIVEYVYTKLYFQGQPVTDRSALSTKEKAGPNLTKSAIGHLLPIEALHRLKGHTPARIFKEIEEVRPDCAAIFAPENQELIRKLESISRHVPKDKPFRTYLKQAMVPLREMA